MSKALLAWVWVAGPLTGTIVQPYVGIRSDNCRSRWGRRKPFIAIGGATTVICLLALAWVRELSGTIFAVFGVNQDSDSVKSAAIVGAIILMFGHDFGINTGEYLLSLEILHKLDADQLISPSRDEDVYR